MEKQDIKIKQRFKELIPPLSAEEYSMLEQSLLDEGCRDAIILWYDTIVDGHNRYEICMKHGIPFRTENMNFDSEDEAEAWILKNQLSRRNITPFVRAQIALRLKPFYEEKAKANMALGGKEKAVDAVNIPINTRKELAKAAQVSEQTLSRVEKIENEASDEIKDAVASGEISINEAFGQLRAEKRRTATRDAISAIQNAGVKVDEATFICGDCCEELEKLPDESIHCVITDPPYGINMTQNSCDGVDHISKKVLNDTADAAFPLLDKVCEILTRKMADNTHFYCFTSWKVYSEVEAIIKKYFKICTVLVWDKGAFGQGDTECTWGEQYELCIYAMKGRRPLLAQREGNVLRVDRVPTQKRYHSCEKPIDLLRKFIEMSTVEGEIVCDMFAGSASTLVAAKLTGRRYWGCELDKDIYEMAKGRLALAGTESGETL